MVGCIASAEAASALTGGPDGTPWLVASDQDGSGHSVNFRLEHYTSTGVYISSAALPGATDNGEFGIAFAASGDVWVSGNVSSGTAQGLGVWRFNPTASALVGSSSYYPQSGAQIFAGPLAVDSSGNAWVGAAEQTSSGFTFKQEVEAQWSYHICRLRRCGRGFTNCPSKGRRYRSIAGNLPL